MKMIKMKSRAQKLLESFNDYTHSDDVIRLHANHRSGVRCLDCGRMLNRVHTLPSVRTCPNGDCGSRFQIERNNRGLGIKKL